MRSSQSSATRFHAQREDEAMWRALAKRTVRPSADQRISEPPCKLPRTMRQDKPKSVDSVDDDDQWSGVCKDEYRKVVQRGKELWHNWSSCSDDVTRESIVSHQSSWPEIKDNSSVVFQSIDSYAVDGCSGQVDQIMTRRDHQPGEGSAATHDPLRDHAASALFVQNDKRVLAHAPPGEQRRELSGQSLGESVCVVNLQRNDNCTDKQLSSSLPCDVTAPVVSAIHEGIEVLPTRYGRKKR